MKVAEWRRLQCRGWNGMRATTAPAGPGGEGTAKRQELLEKKATAGLEDAMRSGVEGVAVDGLQRVEGKKKKKKKKGQWLRPRPQP